MVSQIVTNVQALDLAVLAKLLKQILIKILEVVLDFAGIKGLALRVNAGSDHVGALVHVGEKESGANTRFSMQPGAPISMTASSDLEIEGTVNSILLCSEDRR